MVMENAARCGSSGETAARKDDATTESGDWHAPAPRTWKIAFASPALSSGFVRSTITSVPDATTAVIDAPLARMSAFSADSATTECSSARRCSSGADWPLTSHAVNTSSQKAPNAGLTPRRWYARRSPKRDAM